MNALLNWFAMGGYALYVWPAYAVVGLVLVGNLIALKWYRSSINRKLSQWFKG